MMQIMFGLAGWEIVGTLLLAGGVLIAYLFPTLRATGRRHRNTTAIAVLNVFLGWTVIGWVVALAWAEKNDPVVAACAACRAPTGGGPFCPRCGARQG